MSRAAGLCKFGWLPVLPALTRRSGLLQIVVVSLAMPLLLTGCVTGRDEIRPLPSLTATSPADAWRELSVRQYQRNTLASYASIRVTTPERKRSFKAQIRLGVDGRFRLDAFSPVGTAVLTLFVDGEDATFADHVHHTAWRGPFGKIARLLGLPDSIRASQFARLTFGLPADGAAGEWTGVNLVEQDGLVYDVTPEGIASVRALDGTWSAVLDSPGFPPKEIRVRAGAAADAVVLRHIDAGLAQGVVEPLRIDPSYTCCIEPAGLPGAQ